ncbi:hypothetical protein FEAC_19830 [Ferrimicrobium acidiphilum DSM 19497]|uniref:Uncharacterized protein n=1 Tax=Ferrimicrobium acidiphilum DSM 19497 TaxID=1121877 RepID=A0A0D8FSK0_9ACTN|nr:hypothetical protein [Ferrimicrobium acidiphilum]KJE76248.1 hypothetical protein FEAC_19830 [Ferrimicrobium acidiphilum DSM 19497]
MANIESILAKLDWRLEWLNALSPSDFSRAGMAIGMYPGMAGCRQRGLSDLGRPSQGRPSRGVRRGAKGVHVNYADRGFKPCR